MAVPRLMLLTATPPGAQQSAGHFLRDICMSYPSDSICCFCITRPEWHHVPEDLDWLPIAYANEQRLIGTARLGPRVMPLGSLMLWYYYKTIKARDLVAGAVQYGRSQGIEVVMATLNNPVQIHIAAKVAYRLGAQLVAMVWDPPEFHSMAMAFDRYSSRNLLSEFDKTLRATVRCGVASEGMAEEYQKRYGIDPVVLIHGVHPHLVKPPAMELNSDNRLVLGFQGALYATNEWEALLSALSEVNWQIEGRNVVVRVLTNIISFKSDSRMNIEYLGWRSLEETIELMSQVDVAYLPYWFHDAYRPSVRLCFPNKITTYFAAGRPVLFHGPEDSSPTRFLNRFPAGLCCHSLHSTDIIECLRKFIVDKEFYANATQAGQQAIDQELNLHVFRRRFASLIGIEETGLRPMM